MAKALDSGKAFIEGVLAKLPENLRESARASLLAPEAVDALTAVGDGVLARSDYSKLMDDLREKESTLTTDYDNLKTWYAQNETRLKSVETLEAEVARLKGQPPITTPPADKPTGISQAEFEEQIRKREEQAAMYLNASQGLGLRHYQMFGDVLDLNDLMSAARKSGRDIIAEYQHKFAEPLAKKAQEQEDLRINKIVADRIAEERKKNGGDQPFPLKNTSPSVLDVLESKDHKPSDHTIDTAVAEYERLQAARG